MGCSFLGMKDIKEIAEALKTAGIKKSEVTEYVFVNEYGTRETSKPRTKSLRFELEMFFIDDDSDYIVDEVFVNAMKQVVVKYRFNYDS